MPPNEDPRLTIIGNFIRKTSIDEFPQFINVLRGEMSFIGPRPILDKVIVRIFRRGTETSAFSETRDNRYVASFWEK